MEGLEYDALLKSVLSEIHFFRYSVAKTINTISAELYWNIGKKLYNLHREEGYGSGIVQRLSNDLKQEFPTMGLSPRNLWNMKRFYERYKEADEKLQRCVAVLPWRHNLLLLDKIKTHDEAYYYATIAIEKGYSRDMLLNYIKADSYLGEEKRKKLNNFETTLPENRKEYANEVFKNTYNLGFLGIVELSIERELEKRLVEKIKHFLLELGKGFSFISNQYRVEFNGKEYYIDMLFYHRGLQSLVAIELKIGSFKPEFVGKMNFYLSLLDKQERQDHENPSIGIILCADKDHLDVEMALQDIHKPIGVADFQLIFPKSQLEKVIMIEMKKGER